MTELLAIAVTLFFALGPHDSYSPLPVDEALAATSAVAVLVAFFALPAAVVVWRGSKVAITVVAPLLLLLAAVFGFIAAVLTAAARCTTCDDA